MNPFLTKSYIGPEYFIDRIKETDILTEAIENDRNLTLFSHRRLGKTMLLSHVFAKLDKKRYQPLFIDLFATRNITHLIRKTTEVFYDRKALHQGVFNKILGGLGASISFDPITGSPQVNFSMTDRNMVLKSLPELFKQLEKSKKKVVIAFDEFQEVAGYEEEIAEATIRTIMQEFPAITFIFSGSKKSLMNEIFTDANRPFFQSTQMMELHEIDQDLYANEVHSILERHHKNFDPEVIRKILEETYCHTGFTQMVLSRVYSESVNTIDFEVYRQVWSGILEDHKSMAREQEFLLPRLQWQTLVAVAKEEFVSAPQSKEFIHKYHLSTPSSVARAIKALLDKGIIIDCVNRGLRVYNVFIQKNLQSFPL
ncbi:MAG TPA: ATP-binding protein [Bacteroides sp.]|nr:ATP-binding protein [Bacteroides sp.]